MNRDRDLLEILHDDHQSIERLLEILEETQDREARLKVFQDLEVEMEVHSVAEQDALYSQLVLFHQTFEVAAKAQEDHDTLRAQLEALREHDPEDAGWTRRLQDFATTFRAHTKYEEEVIFTLLQEVFAPGQMEELATSFQREKRFLKDELAA